MGNRQNNPASLMDASLALDCYLETLLTEHDSPSVTGMQGGAPETTGTDTAFGLANVPEWAHQPFVVLVFRVGNKEFLAPLQDVGGIEVMPDARQITVSDSLPAWTLGVAEVQQQRMAIINTPLILSAMEQGADGTEECYNVVIHASRKWGLACGEIMGNETVSPADFHWPGPGKVASQQPWLLAEHQARPAVLVSLRNLLPIKK